MEKITSKELQAAMVAANITSVFHHSCGICDYPTSYIREGENIYFDSGCGCTSRSHLSLRTWDSVADWVNMQNEENQSALKKEFGFYDEGWLED